jgi:hypothetical protein
MEIGRVEGFTRVLGRGQGYVPLPIKDIRVNYVGLDGREVSVPAMLTAWFPTPEEMQLLLQGAPIMLTILGNGHPPVTMEVGRVPEEDNGNSNT